LFADHANRTVFLATSSGYNHSWAPEFLLQGSSTSVFYLAFAWSSEPAFVIRVLLGGELLDPCGNIPWHCVSILPDRPGATPNHSVECLRR
jgi:hypothetical protein